MKLFKYIYPAFLVLIFLSSINFEKTNGLVASIENDITYYTAELKSSGSDDNVIIAIGAIFSAILLFLRIFRINKPVSNYESIAVIIIFCIQSMSILFMIEVGNLFLTVVKDHNAVLTVWAVSYLFILMIASLALFNNLKVKFSS